MDTSVDSKYTVLMSVYVKAKVEELRISIDSMLNQTIPPDQFVIVLDGPVTPTVKECIMGYHDKFPSIFSIIPLKENHGLAYALNIGLNCSRNELVARMDGDDYSLPTRCEKQLAAFHSDKELSLVGTFTRNFERDFSVPSDTINEMPVEYSDIRKTIRRSCPFEHPSVMFKKSAVVACGYYNPDFRRSQDHDLFSRMVCAGYKASNIPEALLYFRADERMMGRNKSWESCKARIKIQRRLYNEGNCNLGDYLYILLTMSVSLLMPVSVYSWLYKIVKGR